MELRGDRMGELAPVAITWSCVFLDHNVLKIRKYVRIKNILIMYVLKICE
jgi:hypothetical protein